jgi:hypothetical protein
MAEDESYYVNALFVKQAQRFCVIVQALASQGGEVALFHALFSTWTVDLLIVSPLFCGSNPYPCGSLTYRKG